MLDSQPMTLEYFDRTISGNSVLYTAKQSCFVPLKNNEIECRYFLAGISEDGRFVINQCGLEGQYEPTLPAEASLELANIFVDWMRLKKND